MIPFSESNHSASFRDPSGRLLVIDGRVIRLVNQSGITDLEAFLTTKTAKLFQESGRLVRTKKLEESEVKSIIDGRSFRNLIEDTQYAVALEHERIPFQSFPYEWPPEMLHAAGLLTLDLAESLLAEGFGLKDATPYNILFRGAEPVFVDLLSFEKRASGDPLWTPNAQFERTFLLPLLANREFQIPPDQIFTSRRDGLEPEDVYKLLGGLRRFAPGFLSLVTIPTLLASRQNQDNLEIYKPKRLDDAEKARFILESLFGRARRKLGKLAPQKGRQSEWSDYMQSNNNYSQEHLRAKVDFVEAALSEFTPAKVLDVGANTGHFSALAARSGAHVVAIDYDPVVVGEIWHRAKGEKLNILPLVVNLTRPSPATGWRNLECPSFLDRACGNFDAVMMLAVIHHMLVTERIPLAEIIDLAAELTTDMLIVEFISPEDSMFKRISRGRDHLFTDLTKESFEASCHRHFEIVRSQHLDRTTRWLYLLRKKR